MSFRTQDDETLSTLAALSCCDLSDALDRLGIDGQCLGIKPLATTFRLAGRAWTLRYGPVGDEPGTVGDYIDELHAGDIVVLDNRGRTDATVWGDILTQIGHGKGLGGTVIDGVCRDIDRSLALHYPVFSRGNTMRTGKDRVRVEAVQEPVAIGGVRILPGDYLKGDGDGLVAIPATRIAEVLAAAQEIRAKEDRIRAAVSAGVPLRQARASEGYHSLQTRR